MREARGHGAGYRAGGLLVPCSIPIPVWLAILLLVLSIGGCVGDPVAASPGGAYAATIVDETNEVRRAEGLPALTVNECAVRAAGARALDLVAAEELVHAPLAAVIEDCAPGSTAGENLSRASAAPEDVVGAWMRSSGHRGNLLDPTFTRLGVVCVDDAGALLCSQVFLG